MKFLVLVLMFLLLGCTNAPRDLVGDRALIELPDESFKILTIEYAGLPGSYRATYDIYESSDNLCVVHMQTQDSEMFFPDAASSMEGLHSSFVLRDERLIRSGRAALIKMIEEMNQNGLAADKGAVLDGAPAKLFDHRTEKLFRCNLVTQPEGGIARQIFEWANIQGTAFDKY